MTWALTYKEFRETAGIAALGMAALLVVVAQNAGWSIPPGSRVTGEIPFLSGSFDSQFFMWAGLLALVLGFRQSLGDFYAGTYLFLLHRPISREQLFAIKVLVGLGSYAVAAALPVLIYAWWAATPGTHASPFGWWMTAFIWREWLMLGTIYLGAFLSGIRPGRWLGTRLFPLLGTLLFLPILLSSQSIVAYPLFALLCVALVGLIFFVSRTRDFA